MYASHVGKQKVTLKVSGMLWNRSLVMMDQETKSLWSHILGRCMDGKLKGKVLRPIPSTMSDWGTWRELHPQTTVVNLSRTSRQFRRDFYKNANRFVLGFAEPRGKAKAWSFKKLASQTVINDKVGETQLAIFFDAKSKTALAYDRRLDQQTLTFKRQNGKVVDQETGSVWNPLAGVAVAGKLKGEALEPLPAIVSFTAAWLQFHPKTTGLSKEEIAQARPRRRRPLTARQRQQRAERRRRLRVAIALMKKLDTNQDGKLSQQEATGAKLPKKADQNKDGVITFKELIRALPKSKPKSKPEKAP